MMFWPQLIRRFACFGTGRSWHSLDWLEKPFLVTAGLGVFAWCVLRRTGPALSATLAILVTLLFYRSGYFNYQMVPFLLISYWVVSEWQQLREHSGLAALLGGYFGVLAIFELVHWSAITIVRIHRWRYSIQCYCNAEISFKLCVACPLGSVLSKPSL